MSVEDFLTAVEPAQRQADARAICELMGRITGRPPVMWGPSIVGFGKYRYRYESGREGEACLTGFSPRKAALVLYLMSGFSGEAGLMARLGKHTTGKSCLYVKKLADIDLAVLEELVAGSVDYMRKTYETE